MTSPATTPARAVPAVLARRAGAALVTAVALACLVPSLVWAVSDGRLTELPPADVGAALSFSAVGAFLLLRDATPAIAGILGAQGVTASITVITSIVVSRAARSGSLHGVALWTAWVGELIWLPGVVLLVPLVLLFPDGRLPGRRWRWVIAATVCFALVFAGSAIVTRHSVEDSLPEAEAPNPTGVLTLGPLGHTVLSAVQNAIVPAFGLMLLLSLGALIARRRRSHGAVRAQVTCLFYGAAVTASLFVLSGAIPQTAIWSWIVAFFGVSPIGIAISVAVLRYRLWEIDRLVSRTVAYLVVLGVLAGVYVGVLAALAALVPSNYGQVGVATATLAVTVLAVPLLRRVRRAVDRRFDRSRFDAERVAAAFAARLRGRPDREDVPSDLLAVVGRTVQPAHAAVWLLPTSGARP